MALCYYSISSNLPCEAYSVVSIRASEAIHCAISIPWTLNSARYMASILSVTEHGTVCSTETLYVSVGAGKQKGKPHDDPTSLSPASSLSSQGSSHFFQITTTFTHLCTYPRTLW